ncbi:MAG: hypothetical protein LQ350_004864 [Teloschistes chrysophthalmus]|nr:MAG: hypothetical protein LQ350_004864 [Niorma chrysophthalma]
MTESISETGKEPLEVKPDDIRNASASYVSQLADSESVDADTVAKAFGRPTKPCDNVGCGGNHILEDCELLLKCSGCGGFGHVAHECTEKCKWCFSLRHISARCTARYYHGGRREIPTPPARPQPVQRQMSERRREIPPLLVRLERDARALRDSKAAAAASPSSMQRMLQTLTTRSLPSNPAGYPAAAAATSSSSRPMPAESLGHGGFPGFPPPRNRHVFSVSRPSFGPAGPQSLSSSSGAVPPAQPVDVFCHPIRFLWLANQLNSNATNERKRVLNSAPDLFA